MHRRPAVAHAVEIHGQTLIPGQKIGLLFISASRDERKWADAETFDIRRAMRDHLGLGAGLRACLGAALPRLEARVALQEILAAMPDFRVDAAALERMHPPVRGYAKVPVCSGKKRGRPPNDQAFDLG